MIVTQIDSDTLLFRLTVDRLVKALSFDFFAPIILELFCASFDIS